MTGSHGLRFDRTQFWVIHRRLEYGPFDYDWCCDLSGVMLHYQGVKFGEIYSCHEFFADMSDFRLPRRVVHVASVVIGCTALGISRGYNSLERLEFLTETLKQFDCNSFVPGTLEFDENELDEFDQ
ncbi:MAG TPA: hypothetical protein VNQ76_18555 [Planctomicrobium sp.]|nr:hypothetical protein [Planctomicrobium sp.]